MLSGQREGTLISVKLLMYQVYKIGIDVWTAHDAKLKCKRRD